MITKERAEEISKTYYRKIFDFCFSHANNNYNDAVDITQEVFLVFSKKLNVLEDIEIEHWLYSVAKKKTLEYYRRVRNDEIVTSLEDSFTSPDEILSTISRYYSVSDADIKMTLEAITKLLTKNEYELYIKKFVENKSQAEIANELNISVSSVSTRTARLRSKIEKLGFLCLTFVGQIIIINLF
ncbi:MAG: sigma-70 family RNA polymerase sigma factor [Clostridia bacterium]|nr:sigma-70 family RNA polymerase sigma factor [Clostridia bacterium]